MKTSIALIVAVGMGIAGAALNFLYLNEKSQELEKTSFLAVKPHIQIRKGEIFRDDHFTKVDIPGREPSEYMKQFVEPWTSKNSVVGMKATRDYTGTTGELVLIQDLKTPAPALDYGPNERVLWIAVDARTFVPSQINPGNYVSFMVPDGPGMAPQQRPVVPFDPDNPAVEIPAPAPPGKFRWIGKFKVISIGNRLSTFEVAKAHGQSMQQENILGIVVIKGSENERAAETVMQLLQQSSQRQAGVRLHNANEKEE